MLKEATVTVIGPASIALPTAMGGDDQMFGLIDICNSRGLVVTDAGDTAELRGIKNFSLFTKTFASLCVSKGCKVYNFPAWFRVAPTDEVPEGVPERTYVNDADETVVKTWEQWCDDSHRSQFMTERADGYHYCATVQNNAYMEWSAVLATGLTVVDTVEYKAILAQGDTE